MPGYLPKPPPLVIRLRERGYGSDDVEATVRDGDCASAADVITNMHHALSAIRERARETAQTNATREIAAWADAAIKRLEAEQ